jgi:tetratricopeptide (TPR) repeat protein
MAQDSLGNPISARRPETVAAIDDFVLGYLGYDLRIVNVLAAADDDAEDALVNAYAGLLWMLSETGGIPDAARRYLARAEQAEAAALPREREVVAVLRCWIADDVPASLRVVEQILQAHPRDLAMLKLHQYHDFNTGDFPAMLRVALGSLQAAGDVAYLHGMLAFAYEQLHLLDQAEGGARHALGLQRREPWAQHALAHVTLTQGRIGEGAAFLESMRDTWGGLTSFMYTHLWWHLALFYLSQGRFQQALAAYDEHCWSQQKDFSQDQIGAVSLLARFMFAGIDVGERWQELGAYLADRQHDVAQPFLTLQYFYGLARAGRPEAAILLAAIRRAPVEGPQASRVVWRDIGVPLAEGLAAHAAGDHLSALRLIEPHLSRLMDIGGSHAQRDLFDQIVLDALLQSGQCRRAQQILETRRLSDQHGVPVNRALAQVYAQLGLPALAAEAQARADRGGVNPPP